MTSARKETSDGTRPLGALKPNAFDLLKRNALIWFLFFLICLGLGYPALRRYNPRTTEGLSDTIIYYQMIAGEPSGRARADIFRARVLVPLLAKPLYELARARIHSADPAVLALLIASSLFCATTALLLVHIGQELARDAGTALLAATLYLLNFDILNLQLAGIIDAGESCLILATVWSLLSRRWRLLPLLGILGALAKETFLPFSCVLMLVWWWSGSKRGERLRVDKLRADGPMLWMAASITLSLITLILTRVAVVGQLVWPWNIAAELDSRTNYLASFWRCVSDHNFWYVLGWLLPLGLWRLRRLPRAWVLASAAMGATALLFGTYSDMQGTVARPIFNTTGPILSLSVALLLTDFVKGKNESLRDLH